MKNHETPKISSSEWEVMNVLWESSPQTAQQVSNALQKMDWKPKTVSTFLTRLVDKRVILVNRQGKAFEYSPCFERKDYIRSEGASFLEKVFKGASGSLLAHFCEESTLTDDEIAELQQILQKKKKSK